MTSSGKVRIYELSKDLGLENKDVLDAAEKLAIAAKSHSSSISDDEAARIRNLIKGGSNGAAAAAPAPKSILSVKKAAAPAPAPESPKPAAPKWARPCNAQKNFFYLSLYWPLCLAPWPWRWPRVRLPPNI